MIMLIKGVVHSETCEPSNDMRGVVPRIAARCGQGARRGATVPNGAPVWDLANLTVRSHQKETINESSLST